MADESKIATIDLSEGTRLQEALEKARDGISTGVRKASLAEAEQREAEQLALSEAAVAWARYLRINLPALLTALTAARAENERLTLANAAMREALMSVRSWLLALDPMRVSASPIMFQIDATLAAPSPHDATNGGKEG